jgi:hypothetical protein
MITHLGGIIAIASDNSTIKIPPRWIEMEKRKREGRREGQLTIVLDSQDSNSTI